MRLQFCNELVESEPRRGSVAEHVRHKRPETAFVLMGRTRFNRRGANERSDAAPGLQHSGPLELAVDARDGVSVDPELDGELTDGGKLVSEAQPSGRDGGPQTAFELSVDGRPIT